jgi:DNA polymerase I
MSQSLLVLFDGNAIAHRAYHAFEGSKYKRGAPLSISKTGEIVSVVYGFALMLLKVLSDLKPTHVAVAFDKKGPTFRHELFEEYKANRPATPEDLISQMARVKQLVKAFNIPIFEIEKYEADDVLGTLSRQASGQGVDTVIVTGDADTMQLVTSKVKILYPKPGKTFSDTMLYDEESVREKYGIGPEHITDYKALVGDPSDNIPGVKGIGDKTAVKLIQQFGSIENIYAHIEEVTPPRLKELLRQNQGVAMNCKNLATIVTETPIQLSLDDCRIGQYDRQQVADLFRELEFYSLLPKLPGVDADAIKPPEIKTDAITCNYRVVATPEALDEMISYLSGVKSFTFDTETTGLNPMLAQPVGISLAAVPGQSYYIPVGHITLDAIKQLPREQVVEKLKPLFEGTSVAKVAHNAKFDMSVLAECGIDVRNVTFDTSLAAYLLGEKSLGLKALAFSRLGIEMTPIHDLIGAGAKSVPMSQVDIQKAADYSCADADMTLRLVALLEADLRKQNLWQLFEEVEMPLLPVLLMMERHGIALDTALLAKMSVQLGEQVKGLEQKIYSQATHEFNINSPAQLGKVLFEELQLPNVRRGKTKYSTEASILEELRPDYPIIGDVLEYRQLTKLKSTYVDALPALINPRTGRIHTSFNQARTTTGRLSSSDPNLQNIPVRGELGGQVRQAFIAPEGSQLLCGDYSQIDLRVLAHLSQDESLLHAFKNDEDIHSATAAQLFSVEAKEVTKDQRRLAKTVNFGVIYGMSDYGLEQATELSREDAGKFITAYFAKYPGVRKYLDATKEQARTTGYVQTMLGRRRLIPDINSANRQVREAAERMAINMPVQGTSADIIKVAMINLYHEMEKRQLKSKMLLQVHDELVFEVPEAEMDEMRKLVPEVMASAVKLRVPVKVDTKIGKNWGEAK